MVFSKSFICALAMGVIPRVFASPINLEHGLTTRDGPKPILVPWEDETTYFNVSVGSQKNIVLVEWDTGSYVSWVPNSNVTCDDGTNDCKVGGTFDPLNSTTYVNLGQKWGGAYLSGGDQESWMGTDQVGIGGSNGKEVTFQDFEFAVVYQAYYSGIFGMALSNLPDSNYLPIKLRAQGHITKAAFSYRWDGPLASTGGFLLGGLDLAKYEGDLVHVPLMKSEGGMKIPLDTIIFNGEPFHQGGPATIDTGTSTIWLPKETVANISSALGGGGYKHYNGTYFYIPCDQPANKTLDFVFGEGATVKVPVSELLEDHLNGYRALDIELGDFYLLGVPLQKYAYWVYDQDEYTTSIGKPTYSSDSAIVNL